MSEIKLLNPVERWWFDLMYFVADGDGKRRLRRRWRATQEADVLRKAKRQMIKGLSQEAKRFGFAIIERWRQLGYAYFPQAAGIATDGRPLRGKKRKVQKVQFSRVKMTAERITFRVEINRRFGIYIKNVLPQGVSVNDLIKEDTLKELSFACERLVTAEAGQFNRGVHVIVNRLEGADGIPAFVSYADVLPILGEFYEAKDNYYWAPFLAGIGQSRKPELIRLNEFCPHLFIAGSSGSGKSNMLKQLICTYARFMSHEDLKLVLIDPKMNEFKRFKHLPHILEHQGMNGIVYNAEDTVKMLTAMGAEILRRNKFLHDTPYTDIAEYNKHAKVRIPQIVIIIDELAQLTTVGKVEQRKAIRETIGEICNLGRSVGVHLFLATQQPSAKVLLTSVMANMNVRLVGRVPTWQESKQILGDGSARDLPEIRGRIYLRKGGDGQQVQTAKIENSDIDHALAIAAGRADGLVALNGYEPEFVPDGLLPYIVDRLKGRFGRGDAETLIHDMAVPDDELLPFIGQLARQPGRYEFAGRAFMVQPTRKALLVVDVSSKASHVSAASEIRELPLLESGIRLLPAPKVIEVAEAVASDSDETNETPITQPKVEVVWGHEASTKTSGELLDIWIREKCEQGRRMKEQSSILHENYVRWLEKLDPEIEPLNLITFGRALSKRGFTRKKSGGLSYWVGIQLADNEGEHSSNGDNISVA